VKLAKVDFKPKIIYTNIHETNLTKLTKEGIRELGLKLSKHIRSKPD
jgi:hypothetical protein